MLNPFRTISTTPGRSIYFVTLDQTGPFKHFHHDAPINVLGYRSMSHYLVCTKLRIRLTEASIKKTYNNIVEISEIIGIELSSRQAISDIVHHIREHCQNLEDAAECRRKGALLLTKMWSYERAGNDIYTCSVEGRKWLNKQTQFLHLGFGQKFSEKSHLGQLLLATHSTNSRYFILDDLSDDENQLGLELMAFRSFLKFGLNNTVDAHSRYREYKEQVSGDSGRSEEHIPIEPLLRVCLVEYANQTSDLTPLLREVTEETRGLFANGISTMVHAANSLQTVLAAEVTTYFLNIKDYSSTSEATRIADDGQTLFNENNPSKTQISVSREDPTQCAAELIRRGQKRIVIIVSEDAAPNSCYQELRRTSSLGAVEGMPDSHSVVVHYHTGVKFIRKPIGDGYCLLPHYESRRLDFDCVVLRGYQIPTLHQFKLALNAACDHGVKTVVIGEIKSANTNYCQALRSILLGFNRVFTECHFIAPTKPDVFMNFYYDQVDYARQLLQTGEIQNVKLLVVGINGKYYPASENPFNEAQQASLFDASWSFPEKLAKSLPAFIGPIPQDQQRVCVGISEERGQPRAIFGFHDLKVAQRFKQRLSESLGIDQERLQLELSAEGALSLCSQLVSQNKKNRPFEVVLPRHNPLFPRFFVSINLKDCKDIIYLIYFRDVNPLGYQELSMYYLAVVEFQSKRLQSSGWFKPNFELENDLLVELFAEFHKSLVSMDEKDKTISLNGVRNSIHQLFSKVMSYKKYQPIRYLFTCQGKLDMKAEVSQLFSSMLEKINNTLPAKPEPSMQLGDEYGKDNSRGDSIKI